MSNVCWQTLISSVRGAAHLRQGLPNQDAFFSVQDRKNNVVIMAVADGHGSPHYVRSQVGSRLAVRETVSGLYNWYKTYKFPINFSRLKYDAISTVPRMLVKKWSLAVQNHLQYCHLSPDEQEQINGHLPAENSYGTTLLVVLLTRSFVVYWQLGDGDILHVQPNGVVIRPLPKNEQLLANETFSLCQKEAWYDFQCRFQRLEREFPQLILLATDGYANSFSQEEDFLQVAEDLCKLSRKKGINHIQQQLPTWLQETSIRGSGDDITVGLIFQQA